MITTNLDTLPSVLLTQHIFEFYGNPASLAAVSRLFQQAVEKADICILRSLKERAFIEIIPENPREKKELVKRELLRITEFAEKSLKGIGLKDSSRCIPSLIYPPLAVADQAMRLIIDGRFCSLLSDFEFELNTQFTGVSEKEIKAFNISFDDIMEIQGTHQRAAAGRQLMEAHAETLKKMTRLRLFTCAHLQELPPEIGLLTGLEVIEIDSDNAGIKQVPETFKNLTELKTLSIRDPRMSAVFRPLQTKLPGLRVVPY